MKSTSTILLVQRAGAVRLYLNGMEAFGIVGGTPARRVFVYPSGTQKFGVRHLQGKPVLLGLIVGYALSLFNRYPKQEGDHSRLLLTDESGVIHSFLNGLPVTLMVDGADEPQLQPFLALADEADAEFLAEEKAAEKNREGAGQLQPTMDERMGLAYDVLVRVCGAHENERESFLLRQAEENHPREWRFSGALGFGGKFWRNSGRLYVSCYQEDETSQRQTMITEANRQLALV